MSNTLKFKTFCFEMYKAEKGMTGIMTQQLFEKYKVFEYLDTFYEVLHTTGDKYIINDIDLYIEARTKAKNKNI